MSLTPRAVVLAALVATLGIVGLWNPDVLPVAWKLAAAGLLLGLVYEWVTVTRLWPEVEFDDSPTLSLGREVELVLAFRNRRNRRLDLQYAPALPDGVAGGYDNRRVVLEPVSTTNDRVPARAVRLGQSRWQTLPARLLGPLGLAHWPGKLAVNVDLDVVPDTLGSGELRLAATELGAESRQQIGSGMELHHLRPYRRGDPPNAIDWKATARSGDLVTRIFGEDQHLEIIICIDSGRTSRLEIEGMTQVSHYVNLAARFAQYAALADDRVGLVVFSDRIRHLVPPRRGLAGVQGIRRALAGLQPEIREADLLAAALSVRSLAKHRSLVILLTSLYDRGANPRLARFVASLSPQHLPVVVGTMSEEIGKLATQPARSWLDPYRSLAAQEYQRDLLANADLLTRMGAHTISTRPSALDGRVFSLYDRLKARHQV